MPQRPIKSDTANLRTMLLYTEKVFSFNLPHLFAESEFVGGGSGFEMLRSVFSAPCANLNCKELSLMSLLVFGLGHLNNPTGKNSRSRNPALLCVIRIVWNEKPNLKYKSMFNSPLDSNLHHLILIASFSVALSQHLHHLHQISQFQNSNRHGFLSQQCLRPHLLLSRDFPRLVFPFTTPTTWHIIQRCLCSRNPAGIGQ